MAEEKSCQEGVLGRILDVLVYNNERDAGTWVHWTVWNIHPKTLAIGSGDMLPGGAVEGKTSFGKPGYGGPCPPSGTHRYFFKLYALDTVLSLPSSSTKEDLEKAMEGHIIEKGELIGLYSRK